jgi:hypothetical protein
VRKQRIGDDFADRDGAPSLAVFGGPIFPDWRRWRSTRMAPALKSTSDTLRPSSSPMRKPDPASVTIAARM